MKDKISELSENQLLQIVNTKPNAAVVFGVSGVCTFITTILLESFFASYFRTSLWHALLEALIIASTSIAWFAFLTIIIQHNKLNALIKLMRRTKVLTLEQGNQKLVSIISDQSD